MTRRKNVWNKKTGYQVLICIISNMSALKMKLTINTGWSKFTCEQFHLRVLHLVQKLVVKLCDEPAVTNRHK